MHIINDTNFIPESILSFTHFWKTGREDVPVFQENNLSRFVTLMWRGFLEENMKYDINPQN